jgi:16S rRNA (guanine527-N7)-methyltransferase
VEQEAALLGVLERARERGALGPGDVARHLEHARGFVEVATAALGGPPARAADLGTGGGVPGLVLAVCWPASEVSLVESSIRRVEALRAEILTLGLQRCRVLEGRAEDLAHDPEHRERYDLVTARSFGPPAVTGEIAAGFVAVGGIAVVSEPPEGGDRWPGEPLGGLGFSGASLAESSGSHFAGLRKIRAAPPDRPRRRGRAAKRPLW